MHKLITSARSTDDLSIGFHRDRDRKQDEYTDKKNVKVKYHVRIKLKGVFDFAGKSYFVGKKRIRI